MAHLTLAEIQESGEYLVLTKKQKKFVDLYLTNGYDPVSATMAAYNCKTEKSAHCFSYAVLRATGVMLVLALHFGEDPEKQFLALLYKMIRTGRINRQKLAVMRLYADVAGLRKSRVLQAMEAAKQYGVELTSHGSRTNARADRQPGVEQPTNPQVERICDAIQNNEPVAPTPSLLDEFEEI